MAQPAQKTTNMEEILTMHFIFSTMATNNLTYGDHQINMYDFREIMGDIIKTMVNK